MIIDVNVAPIANITVNIALQIYWLTAVHCTQSNFDGNFFAYFDWRDTRLAWNQTAKNGVERISMPVNKIWHPRIDFVSISPTSEKTSFKDETAIIHSDGSGSMVNHETLITTRPGLGHCLELGFFATRSHTEQVKTLISPRLLNQLTVFVRKDFFYVGFCDINPRFYPYDSHDCLIQGLTYQDLNVNLKYKLVINNLRRFSSKTGSFQQHNLQ